MRETRSRKGQRMMNRAGSATLTFGKLRILDLGDLTWDKEMALMCPANKVGSQPTRP